MIIYVHIEVLTFIARLSQATMRRRTIVGVHNTTLEARRSTETALSTFPPGRLLHRAGSSLSVSIDYESFTIRPV